MVYKVLVVDDSTFYRRRLRAILEQDRLLQVVGEASNGQEAVRLAKELSPDCITMDVEMPVMDGISAVAAIMKSSPCPILMFSSLTHDGAQATLDALDAGALDFLPKRFEDIASDAKEASMMLRTKVRIVARRKPFMHAKKPTERPARPVNQPFMRSSNVLTGQQQTSEQVSVSHVTRSGKMYRCLAIGASTGGPVALQTILAALPERFPVPIVIIQHMPAAFTETFAARLDKQCKISVVHGKTGDVLAPGVAYVAPGGKQFELHAKGAGAEILVRDTASTENLPFKPSVDLSFKTLANVYRGDVLGLMLTGMGNDGEQGCEQLKQLGATIWAQDQASSVVYGMPQAVASKGISSQSIGLPNIAKCLVTEVGR